MYRVLGWHGCPFSSPGHLEAVVWPSLQHISAFSSSSCSLGRAVGLLLASHAPSGEWEHTKG